MFWVMRQLPLQCQKSGFSANSQAKVAANAIRGELTGSRVFKPRFANTCWSLIATNDGVKVGANYEAGAEKIDVVDKFISQGSESADVRKATYEESEGWYKGITSDMFLIRTIFTTEEGSLLAALFFTGRKLKNISLHAFDDDVGTRRGDEIFT